MSNPQFNRGAAAAPHPGQRQVWGRASVRKTNPDRRHAPRGAGR
jgi:hypothetical protein